MPLICPLHEFLFLLAVVFLNYGDTVLTVPFLELAENLVEASFDPLQVIIGKLAPPLFQFASELHPYPFELIGIHGFLLLCEIALSSPILPMLTIMAKRPAAFWSKLLKWQETDPVAACRCPPACATEIGFWASLFQKCWRDLLPESVGCM
jgi:hypothetical protein